MTLDEQIAFCEEKSKNIKLKAEPQVFVDIKACLEELKEIRGCISEIGRFIGKEKGASYKQGYSEGIKVAKGELWISVEDRLPESNKTVLCLMCNHRMPQEEIVYDFGRYCNGIWFVRGLLPFKISYWMPLPDMPKEDKQ